MKIIKLISSGQVLHTGGDDLVLTATYASGNGWVHNGLTTAIAVIEDAVTPLPQHYAATGCTYMNSAWTLTPEGQAVFDAKLQAAKAELLRQIRTDDDAIYADTIGNRLSEYTLAEAEATAYKAAGYSGQVPASVSSWADAKGWTAKQATDDILNQAVAWRGAAELIRRNRLAAKENAKSATTFAQVDSISATWGAFVNLIRSQLGV